AGAPAPVMRWPQTSHQSSEPDWCPFGQVGMSALPPLLGRPRGRRIFLLFASRWIIPAGRLDCVALCLLFADC
ncbi:hypothetical protein, partial [Streptomyces sanglieri]|uniref:hypothetical protein n=1 Tax=Streptomyces sanglieri TaxID=193460 RepID=UPI003523EDE7